ncbi:unnamed protein product [Pseudo-nitzschia multistriata]|uniref:Transmembrane protein n=1 Tax=Pseudo-nitzschia multistriata TaxID=183589 RepID=A0A448ZDP9_9STRA|nr:unnamed protein product [Pseudo-nitzschia multistriata]
MNRSSPGALLLLLAVASFHTSEAFTAPVARTLSPALPVSSLRTATAVFAAAGDGEAPGETRAAPKRKRKRKKKAQVVAETAPEETEEPGAPPLVPDLRPREDAPVVLEVRNIVAPEGDPEPSAVAKAGAVLSSVSSMLGSSKGEPGAGSERAVSPPPPGLGGPGRSLDDSLDQLLEDARSMSEEGGASPGGSGGLLSDEEGTGVKQAIGNALSTVVTADFFLVCGFLAWFLLGIFCSYVLKDDTVQIAFNNNFERLVQPALGVLMIAAIGGNFFKEEEEEYDL